MCSSPRPQMSNLENVMKLYKNFKNPLRLFFRWLKYLFLGIKSGSLSHDDIVSLLAKRNPTIFEIGCNDGADTLEFVKRFPEARIFAFEPDPRAILRFKDFLGAHVDRVNLVEVALSDREGFVEFFESNSELGETGHGWDKSGSIRPPKFHLKAFPWVNFTNSIQVPTTTLDSFCKSLNIDHIDFIWMDVQGAEHDVIKGASRTLQSVDYLYTEYSNKELYEGQLSLDELLKLLPDFKVISRFPGDVLLKNRRLG